MTIETRTYLVAKTAANTHWVRRGFTHTLCGLPRHLWYYPDRRQVVTCLRCNQLKG